MPPKAFPNESFAGLMQRLEAGNESAAEVVWEKYAQRICHLAEQEISRRLLRRFDAEDVTQSVLGSFFRRMRNGEFQFDHSGALWNLLVTMTLNKIRLRANYHCAQKRDVRAEADVGSRFLGHRVSDSDSLSEASDAHQLADVVESVVEQLNERDAEFFHLKYRDGLSSVEISEKTGRSVATVNRVIRRIIERIRIKLESS